MEATNALGTAPMKPARSRRRLAWLVAGAVLMIIGATCRAAEEVKPPVEPPKARPARSYARNDQVLARLGLSDEQVAKVDAVHADCDSKIAALRKELAPNGGEMDEKTLAKFKDKQLGILCEQLNRIIALLTAEQRSKANTGWNLMANISSVIAELHEAKEEAHRVDAPDEHQEVSKHFENRVKEFVDEFNKKMDEEVGRLPDEVPKYQPPEASSTRKPDATPAK